MEVDHEYSNYGNLADDFNSKFAGSAVSADPTTHTSWEERKVIIFILSGGSLVYSTSSGLSATGKGAGRTLYGYGWQNGDDITVRIGALFKLVCSSTDCLATPIPANNFGNATSPDALSGFNPTGLSQLTESFSAIWYSMHVIQLVAVWLSLVFMLFVPAPRTDEMLHFYRWCLRITAVLLPGTLAVAYALLSNMASSQSHSTLGVPGLILEALSLTTSSFGLFLASRLVRDPHAIWQRDSQKEAKRAARQRRRQERKDERQKRQATKSLRRALGKEGVKAITMNRLMAAMAQPSGSTPPRHASAEPAPAYPMQPPPARSYGTPMPGYYTPAPQSTPFYGDINSGLQTGFQPLGMY